MGVRIRQRLASLFLIMLLAMGKNAAAAAQPKSKIPSGSKAATPAEPPRKPEEYVIAPYDLLAVNGWKKPEISPSGPVRPDGKISLPLGGDLRGDGRTP